MMSESSSALADFQCECALERLDGRNHILFSAAPYRQLGNGVACQDAPSSRRGRRADLFIRSQLLPVEIA